MADDLIQPESTGNGKTARKQKPIEDPGIQPVEETEGPEIAGGPEVHSVQFGQLSPVDRAGERNPLDLILDVQLQATVELGRSRLSIRDVLGLGPGSVVALDRLAGEPADLLVNGKALARGEVVVIDENFGIRITEILAPTERISSLR